MGKPGWEDETWTPGRSSRGSRADNGERSPGRSYDRDPRTGPGRDDAGPRGSDRDYRPRSSNRGDDWRGSSGRQGASGSGRGSSDPGSSTRDYDDRSGRARSSYGRDDHDSRGSRDYRDPRGSSGGNRDPRRPGGYDDRSMRGPQAPPRNRPPAGGGGGLWGDGFSARTSSNRPRAGYGVATDTPAGSGMGGRQSLDALRANRLRQQGLDP